MLLSLFVLVVTTEFVQATAPTISGILVPINIKEATSTETLLDVFNVTDSDGDVITTCSLTGHSGQFDLRQSSTVIDDFELYLLSTASLNFDNTPIFTLTVTCTDSAGETTSATITVDVIPNQAPTLIPPSTPVNVNENEQAQRRIYIVNVTDPEGDSVSCTISAVSPVTSIFGIWRGSSDYEIYLLNNPNLNHTTTSAYLITVTCSDAFGSSSTQLTVDVEENAPPVFINLPAGSNSSFDASSTPSGTVVYTVVGNDTDSPTLKFSMTSNPVKPDLFEINTDTGVITTVRDLMFSVDTSYDLTVTIFDGYVESSAVLRVEMTNVNTPPVITNLPDNISVSEDITSGSSIFKFLVSEPDDDETITFTLSIAPAVYSSKFFLDTKTYVLSVRENETLDYESQNTFALYIYVSDQKAKTGPYTLNLYLIDVNEPCTFDKHTYYVTTYEANKGSGVRDPGFIISDPDIGDSYTFSLVSSDYSDLFRLDSTTGKLSFDTNYDVDNEVHPSNVTLTVQCTDTAGNTGTATLSVTVTDVNDNSPEFGKTGYIVYCDQWDAPGTKIDDLSAKDDDSGDNGDIEYSWVPADSLYYTLNPNGAIILKVNPTVYMSYGDTYRFIVTARDQGSPARSGTSTVDVVYKEATTTSTTTASFIVTGFFQEPGNVIWVVFAALLGACFLALLAYIVISYCGTKKYLTRCQTLKFSNIRNLKCCRTKTIPSKALPVLPNPKSTPFEFWNDDDMIHRANRPFKNNGQVSSALPQPAVAEL